MQNILTNLEPAALVTAIKANLYAFFGAMRASAVVRFADTAAGMRWHSSVAHPWFNGVLSTQNPGPDAAAAIQETLDYFQSRAVGSFSWWLAPDLDPQAWSGYLIAQGFGFSAATPGMAIDLASLPVRGDTALEIRQVNNKRGLTEWSRIFAEGYGLPQGMGGSFEELMESLGLDLPLRHYLGYLNGTAVATSTLFLGAGVAGIYSVATLAGARGRGFGSAMTVMPLVEARNMGYRAGVLQSSEMGYPVYLRLGFQKLCQMEHFYWPGR